MDPVRRTSSVPHSVDTATPEQIEAGIRAALSRTAAELIRAAGTGVIGSQPVSAEQLAHTIDRLADRSSAQDRPLLRRKAEEIRNMERTQHHQLDASQAQSGVGARSSEEGRPSLKRSAEELSSMEHAEHPQPDADQAQYRSPPRAARFNPGAFSTPDRATMNMPGDTPTSVLSRNPNVDITPPAELPLQKGYTPERDHPSHPAPDVVNRMRASGMDSAGIIQKLDTQLLAPNEQVDYFNSEYTKTLRLEFVGGLAMWQGLKLGSEEAKNKEEHGSEALIGVAHKDHLYVHGEKPPGAGLSRKRVHHSSFFRGKKVGAAFKLFANNGVVTKIVNDSGHHKPGLENLKYMCKLLKGQMKEKDFNQLQVQYIQPDGSSETMKVHDFYKTYPEGSNT